MANSTWLTRVIGSSLKYSSSRNRRYFVPALMLFGSFSTFVIPIGCPAAVLGLICMTPTAPAGLFTDWSSRDSW